MTARRLGLHGTGPLLGGLGYGMAVMVVMSLLVLPRAADRLGAGEPISQMGAEAGWATFIAQFAVFGLALGAWLFIRPQDIGDQRAQYAADSAVPS